MSLVFVDVMRRWLRRHPLAAFGIGGLLSGVVYWQSQASPPPPPSRGAAPAPPFPGVLPPQASLEGALATMQQDNERLRLTLVEQQRALEQLTQAQQRAQAEHERQLEALKHPAAPLQPPPPPLPAPPRPRAPAPGLPPAAPPILRLLRPPQTPAAPPAASTPVAVPTLPPPSWVHLPAGSFVRGRLLTGVFATSQAGGALPTLLAVREAFSGPNQTLVPLHGCLAIGKAQAQLSSLRALVQLDTLSCVLPDGRTLERKVAGYVTGQDGTLGIPGQLEYRAGHTLATTVLASLVAGAAEAFARTESTVVVTPLGGSLSTVTGDMGKYAALSGLATASSRLAEFYLHQAEQLLPVLWVDSGTEVYLVMQQGLTIEGLPAPLAALPHHYD